MKINHKTNITQRRKAFTDVCYAIIGILVENPHAEFALTERRIAERMAKNGWLVCKEMKVSKTAGDYCYQASIVGFIPTEAGLEKYQELRKFVDSSMSLREHAKLLRDLEKTLKGEERKKRLKQKLVS